MAVQAFAEKDVEWVVGCLPDANAWKDHWRCFQITSQVSFLPQDLGKHASSQWLSNVVRLLSKLPQEKTIKLPVLAYSTPSPMHKHRDVQIFPALFQSHGMVYQLVISCFGYSFPKLSQLAFSKAEQLIENSWVVVAQFGEHHVG